MPAQSSKPIIPIIGGSVNCHCPFCTCTFCFFLDEVRGLVQKLVQKGQKGQKLVQKGQQLVQKGQKDKNWYKKDRCPFCTFLSLRQVQYSTKVCKLYIR